MEALLPGVSECVKHGCEEKWRDGKQSRFRLRGTSPSPKTHPLTAPLLTHTPPHTRRYHLIIIQDGDVTRKVDVPPGFDYELYTRTDIERILGKNASVSVAVDVYECVSSTE